MYINNTLIEIRKWVCHFMVMLLMTQLAVTPLLAEQRAYIYQQGNRVMEVDLTTEGKPVSYIMNNQVETATVVVSEKDDVKVMEYKPFGEILVKKGNTSGQSRFGGADRDFGSGLDYFGARYYSSRIGRFLSVDAVPGYGSPYVYCDNNPITYVDPDGNFFFLAVLIGIAVGAMAGAAIAAYTGKSIWKGMLIGALIGAAVTTGVQFQCVQGFLSSTFHDWVVPISKSFASHAIKGALMGAANGVFVPSDRDLFDRIWQGAAAGAITAGVLGAAFKTFSIMQDKMVANLLKTAEAGVNGAIPQGIDASAVVDVVFDKIAPKVQSIAQFTVWIVGEIVTYSAAYYVSYRIAPVGFYAGMYQILKDYDRIRQMLANDGTEPTETTGEEIDGDGGDGGLHDPPPPPPPPGPPPPGPPPG